MAKGATKTSNQVDPKLMAMYSDLYSRAKGVAGMPFMPFTGARFAGFNPDQLQGFEAARGLFDDSMSYDPRANLANLYDSPLDISPFQNTFEQEVIDNALADLDRSRALQLQQDQDSAIGSGAFGGSRSALLEAETNRNFFDRAGNLASNMRLQGYNDAMNRAMNDRLYRTELANQQLADQYRNLGLLSNIGLQQQGLQQQGLDFGYNEFLRQINYPRENLGLLASALGSIPYQGSQVTQQETGTGDVLGTLAQLYGYHLMSSDERLKEDITLLGKVNGHNIYTWKWNEIAKSLGVNNPPIGVIAQEVKETNPDAVTMGDDGYYLVNYGAL